MIRDASRQVCRRAPFRGDLGPRQDPLDASRPSLPFPQALPVIGTARTQQYRTGSGGPLIAAGHSRKTRRIAWPTYGLVQPKSMAGTFSSRSRIDCSQSFSPRSLSAMRRLSRRFSASSASMSSSRPTSGINALFTVPEDCEKCTGCLDGLRAVDLRLRVLCDRISARPVDFESSIAGSGSVVGPASMVSGLASANGRRSSTFSGTVAVSMTAFGADVCSTCCVSPGSGRIGCSAGRTSSAST